MTSFCQFENIAYFTDSAEFTEDFVVTFKGRVICFLMQVVRSKCFLLNPEKKFGADPSCRFQKKTQKNAPLIPKNDVTEPKARLL